jgi:signal transduction histidine kinase
MRRFETPYIADWFAISLRWIVLVGLLLSLGLGEALTMRNVWPLGLLALWNLGMTLLTSLNLRLAYHRLLNVLVDLLLAAFVFHMQGGLSGPAPWSGILPILSGAIYFEIWGALAAGALVVAFLFAFIGKTILQQTLLMVALAGSVLSFSLLFGWLGHQLTVRLRRAREAWLEAEDRRHRIQTERLRAIYELSSTLTTTLSYRRVLDSALDIAFSALNPQPESGSDERLVGAILLFKGGILHTVSARRFTTADLRLTFPASEGILKKVFDDGEPFLSQSVGFDPELGRVIALRNCTVIYCFPLRSGLNVYGVMLFAHPEPGYFTPDRLDLLDIIGRQAVIAIQNARLYQDLVEEKERMIEVHEEARKKLARDLHDGPTQSVSAMAMRVNLTRRLLQKDVKAADEELVRIEELAHRTTKEIRHMLFTLRPLILESQGLKAAIQAMADKMQETFGQKVLVSVDDHVVNQLEMGKQGVIFYIVEEAVNNARKHANAPNIWVRLQSLAPDIVLLEVADDGVGFDVEAVNRAYDKRGSLGMINLRERTELVNGVLNIESAAGKGTRVQVYIPLTEEAADRLHHPR